MIEKKWLEKLDKVHPYPAKFPVFTAEEYITKYSNVGDMVFDPFVGSGSSLLAATANNRFAVGTDINGIAVLISKFKLLNIDDNDIERLNIFLASVRQFNQHTMDFVSKTIQKMRRKYISTMFIYKTTIVF